MAKRGTKTARQVRFVQSHRRNWCYFSISDVWLSLINREFDAHKDSLFWGNILIARSTQSKVPAFSHILILLYTTPATKAMHIPTMCFASVTWSSWCGGKNNHLRSENSEEWDNQEHLICCDVLATNTIAPAPGCHKYKVAINDSKCSTSQFSCNQNT